MFGTQLLIDIFNISMFSKFKVCPICHFKCCQRQRSALLKAPVSDFKNNTIEKSMKTWVCGQILVCRIELLSSVRLIRAMCIIFIVSLIFINTIFYLAKA